MLEVSCTRAHTRLPPANRAPVTDLALPARRDVSRRCFPQHCSLDRRAQICPRQGPPDSRGSADPLDACGVDFLFGIIEEQVCSALPLAHP